MNEFIKSKTEIVINSHVIEVLEFDEKALSDDLSSQYADELFTDFNKAVTKRKAEFIAGRIACRHRLESFGNGERVRVNSDRSPAWPEGFTGSISHDGAIACAVVSPKDDETHSIGIDLCVSMTDNDAVQVADNISTLEELNRFNDTSFLTMDALRLIFSSKESLYKAVYPLVKRFIDFKEVEIISVEGNNDSGFITAAAVNKNDLPLSVVEEFIVHYQRFSLNTVSGFITLSSNRIKM